MKKKLLVYTSWAVSITILFSSCKKYIDLKPKDATYDQVFWSTGDNAKDALSGAYGLLRSSFRADRSYFVFGDLPADGFWLSGNYWNYQSLLKDGGFKYSYAPYLEGSLQNWTRFYQLINQCHLIVENTPNIPVNKFYGGEEEKNRITGEAHFLRAYTYFYITRVWGDPVLTTETLKNPADVKPLPRTPETQVLDYCIKDLKTAAGLLSFNEGTDIDKVQADKGAAWALLAQVYAWKHEYPIALLYCDSIISSAKYSLETADTYTDIWKGGSTESIFELNMLYNADNNEATGNFFGDFLRDPFIQGSYDSWEINTDVTDEIFPDPEKDIRFDKTTTIASDGRILIKYANVDYYDNNNPDLYVVSNNLVLERLAGIYLLKAEALNETGNTAEALNALNIVKQRAGLDDYSGTQEETRYEIMDERRREMTGEGCLAFDMIRTGTLLYYYPDIYTQERIDKKGYYWPLDMRTLLPQDALLTQNPWWINH